MKRELRQAAIATPEHAVTSNASIFTTLLE
jgi:hypothetical protein